MTQPNNPRVVIGLLVYNGERYLAETIDSILNQTFKNFHLVIADNASTDATEKICREYAEKDSRITYHRHSENIGASGNHNFLFQPGNAPYFKWASHDDLLGPDYLGRCVELLDANSSIGVAHSRSYVIDETGNKIDNLDYEVRLNSSRPSERFWRLLWGGYLPEVHGVMRSNLVKNTKLYQGFTGDDRNFLGEMLLQADVGYVEDYQFYRRDHADCFCRIKDNESRQQFFNPQRKRSAKLAGLSKFKAYVAAVLRYPLPLSERVACARAFTEWALRRGIEAATGSGEQFGEQLRREFAAHALAVTNQQELVITADSQLSRGR